MKMPIVRTRISIHFAGFVSGAASPLLASTAALAASPNPAWTVWPGETPANCPFEKSDPSPYTGRYPCGSLVHNGVWYYGTYCLHPSGGVRHDGVVYNWPWLGPFIGFRYSTDFGKTWMQSQCTPEKPLFGEMAMHGEPVKIGSPHFVDFGRNLEHSPDGTAYLVAHGASDGTNRRFAFNSWITGDEIYLLRVTPDIATMNAATKYEFWDGTGWTHDFSKIKPIAAWRDHMGCVTMTYDAPLKKFLMCVTDGGQHDRQIRFLHSGGRPPLGSLQTRAIPA